MKRIVQLFTILSWINLIGASALVFMGLLGLLIGGNAGSFVSVMLTGSVVLHSYAALQLRRSIVYPNVPLDTRVPQGIFIVGFLALFFAISNMAYSFLIIRSAPETMQKITATLPEAYQKMKINFAPIFRLIGICLLVFTLSVITNIMLSFNLMRWYRQRQEQ